jgi:hypothetical protein
MVPSEAPPRGCTGESPPTGQVAKEGNFASQRSNKLAISTVNQLNLREAEILESPNSLQTGQD